MTTPTTPILDPRDSQSDSGLRHQETGAAGNQIRGENSPRPNRLRFTPPKRARRTQQVRISDKALDLNGSIGRSLPLPPQLSSLSPFYFILFILYRRNWPVATRGSGDRSKEVGAFIPL